MNNDLISRQATHLALVEKGQASKRYKLGETWELNGKEIREVLDTLPSIQPVQHWIPCSERLPEEDGSYLVCGRWGSGKIAVGDCEYSTEDGYFQTAWNFDVLAWMPLPEPYQGERKTDE